MNSDLALFLGRFHPALVHLPIGLIIMLAFLELAARTPKFHYANSSAGLILLLAAPLSALTALLGWLLSQSGGYNPKTLQLHQWTGIGTAAGACAAGLLYAVGLKGLYRIMLFASVLAVGVSGHFGGALTHGSDYLMRYAPGAMRQLFPGKPPKEQTPVILTNNPSAGEDEPPLFSSAIQPIFTDKCSSCHGPEKSKAGLRLDSIEGLLKGGDSGPAIVRNQSAQSEIIKRILLPTDNDEHMPPDGKPQITPEELALLRWWIDTGANTGKSAAALKLPANLATTRIDSTQQRPSSSHKNALAQPTGELPRNKALEHARKLSEKLGIPIMGMGEREPWLQVNASVKGKSFTDEELSILAPLSTNVIWLDLSGTAVTDSGLRHLQSFGNLKRLCLQRTEISDAALAHAEALHQLEYANLYGTKITRAGLDHLKNLPRLRQLYLWQTQVTPAEAAQFVESRLNKAQIQQWEQQIQELQMRIHDQQVIADVGVQPPINVIAVSDKGNTAVKMPLPQSAYTNAPSAEIANTTTQPARNPVNALCPVSGKPIEETQTVQHGRLLVGFCCEQCKAKFRHDPALYLDKLPKPSP